MPEMMENLKAFLHEQDVEVHYVERLRLLYERLNDEDKFVEAAVNRTIAEALFQQYGI